MIHLQPTVISLTMSEIKDMETRRRYLRYLQREENPASEETVQRKSTPALESEEPRRTLTSSHNREPSSSPHLVSVDPLPSSPLERIIDQSAEVHGPTTTAPHQETGPALAEPQHRTSFESLDSPSSPGTYFSARPRRPRLFQSSLNSDSSTSGGNALASPITQRLLSASEGPEEVAGSKSTASSRRPPTITMPSLPPPFSQKTRRVSAERTWTQTLVSGSIQSPLITQRDNAVLISFQAIRPRESLGSEIPRFMPAQQQHPSSCHDSIGPQSDGQSGPSVSWTR